MADISHVIRPKSVPLRSIGLTKIDENMPSHGVICKCDMCNKYEAKKVSQMLQQQTKNINNKISSKLKNKHGVCTNFYFWVIKHLMIPHNKIITRGLDIFVSQILFYKQGEASNLFCCKQVDQPIIKRAHKEKLSNTFILKIFGDRRRKYRQIVNTYLGKKKQIVTKKPSFGAKKQVKRQSKDGVIIKYVDALEQLISQNQFLHLLQRRKQDPIWKQIYYFKNYISVEDPLNRILVSKFNCNDITYEAMFARTQKLMRVYGQNINAGDKDYISQEDENKFCKQLLKQSLQLYAQYLLYKIVSFIEYFYDQKIKVIVAKFLINQMGQGFIEDVIKLQTQSLVKFQWTNEKYLQKIDQQEQRVFFSKQVQTNQTIQKNALQIEKFMGKTYEKMKQFFGLSMEEEDDFEQRANNQFFRMLHPEVEGPISQILRSQAMTTEKFKKDFLGYKPKKKPIVKPFNSNLIKSLHNMTPQLHRADPHDFVKIPKRTLSTAFSRSSSYKQKSFSVNKRQSSYTSNLVTALSTPRGY